MPLPSCVFSNRGGSSFRGPHTEATAMKAIQFKEVGGPEVMQLVDCQKPEVRRKLVRVRTHAVGINFADNFFRQGNYLVKAKPPDTPGMEAAGVIDDVGPEVEGLKPGMRVAGVGLKAYAEYSLFYANQIIPLPDFVSFEEGAAFPTRRSPRGSCSSLPIIRPRDRLYWFIRRRAVSESSRCKLPKRPALG